MDQMLNNGRKQTQKIVNQASDLVKDVSGKDIIGQAQQWYDSAEQLVTDVTKRSTSITRRYPLQSILGAAVCGYLLGAIFRRRSV